MYYNFLVHASCGTAVFPAAQKKAIVHAQHTDGSATHDSGKPEVMVQ
jgi:hypothetical protein